MALRMFGAFVIVYLLTRLFRLATRGMRSSDRLVVVHGGAGLLLLLATTVLHKLYGAFSLGGLMVYLPGIVAWLVVDWARTPSSRAAPDESRR